jgi:hypothetical protein
MAGRPRLNIDESVKIDLVNIKWRVWIGLIWLRINSNGGFSVQYNIATSKISSMHSA